MQNHSPDYSKIGKSNVRRSKNHERRVAHLLTEWSNRPFRRRIATGRDSTIIERESTSDIIPATGDTIFTIEAKCGKGFSLNGILENPKTNIFTVWLHQVHYDAMIVSNVMNKDYYPLLFFKPHPNHDFIAFPNHLLESNIIKPQLPLEGFVTSIYKYNGPISHNVNRTKKKANYKYIEITIGDMFITQWKKFADCVDANDVFR